MKNINTGSMEATTLFDCAWSKTSFSCQVHYHPQVTILVKKIDVFMTQTINVVGK